MHVFNFPDSDMTTARYYNDRPMMNALVQLQVGVGEEPVACVELDKHRQIWVYKVVDATNSAPQKYIIPYQLFL